MCPDYRSGLVSGGEVVLVLVYIQADISKCP